jgi:UDP-arabinose 4-epimerase
MKSILVTGGAGYIGSHACKALARAGYRPVTYDSLANGRKDAVRWGPLEQGDIADPVRLRAAIERHKPAAVMHFAAYIQVAESVADPGRYYANNVAGTLTLLDVMRATGLDTIVFSSSAAVYAAPQTALVAEDHPLAPANPYGQTKRMMETILADHGAAHGLRWTALRYFNAAGADPDGEIGANHDPVTSLIPVVLMAGLGTGPTLNVFGTDYDTPDGTAIRDFIHVTDLADAHVAALAHLLNGGESGPINLGTGRGYSVREVIETASRVLGRPIPAVDSPRRPGDLAAMVADARKAASLLNWTPQHSSIEKIIETAAAWERTRAGLAGG